jgi:hypothetical protein
MKKVLYALIAILGFANATMAQVPSYVPTNGLVSAYPFNNNANNEFGNGTNGIVNNVVKTTNRFGILNSAYQFNSLNNSNIDLGINPGINSIIDNFSISYWVYKTGTNIMSVVSSYSDENSSFWRWHSYLQGDGVNTAFLVGGGAGSWQTNVAPSNVIPMNTWVNVTIVRNSNMFNTYINGVLVSSSNVSTALLNNPTNPYATTKIGFNFPSSGGSWYFDGKIDDLFFYNRALTQQEITKLYQGCNDSIITTEPTNTSVRVGLNAQFTTTSASGSTYQWQTNPLNIGWMNVPSNTYYTGVITNTLGVNNVSVSNHNQAFRALVNSTGCADTSKVVYLKVADTCLSTVTDTLIIQTTVGLPTPNISNTLLIYPNPAKDRITIDNGNYTAMSGYSIKIQNSLGQQVFNSAINQAQFNIDLSTWTGKGIYYVRLLDANGNVVTTRKILLQ